MKTVLYVLLAAAFLPFAGFAQEPPAASSSPRQLPPAIDPVGLWKVNWEKSVPHLATIPKPLQTRFATLEEFRGFLLEQTKDMTIELLANDKAIVRTPPRFEPLYGQWRIDLDGKRTWVRITETGVEHGVFPADANRASLFFEIKISPNAVTRVPLLLEKQPVPTSK